MLNKQRHWEEIHEYLERNIALCKWSFTLPKGSGHETYFAHGNDVSDVYLHEGPSLQLHASANFQSIPRNVKNADHQPYVEQRVEDLHPGSGVR